MSGVADHLTNRMNQWLERVERGGADSHLVLQGLALREIAGQQNGKAKGLLARLEAALREMPESKADGGAVSDYLEQTLTEVRSSAIDPDVAFFAMLEALVVAQKKGGDGARLFNWAVTNLDTFEAAAGLAEQQMRGAMRLGRWSAVFCASVARTGWEAQDDEEQEEVGAFEPIEVFARRGGEKWISLKVLSNRLAGVSWWCLKSDFRRLRISIEVNASQLRLEVYEGEVPGKEQKGRTSGSLDGAVVRGRFGGPAESSGSIEKGVAKLRVPERVDVTAFELRVNRGAAGEWVEIYGSQAAGA